MITCLILQRGKKQPCFMFKYYFCSSLEMGIVAAFVSYLLPRPQEVTEIENTTLWFGHCVLRCQTRADDWFDFQREWIVLSIHGAQLSEAPRLALAGFSLRVGWIKTPVVSFFSFFGGKGTKEKEKSSHNFEE